VVEGDKERVLEKAGDAEMPGEGVSEDDTRFEKEGPFERKLEGLDVDTTVERGFEGETAFEIRGENEALEDERPVDEMEVDNDTLVENEGDEVLAGECEEEVDSAGVNEEEGLRDSKKLIFADREMDREGGGDFVGRGLIETKRGLDETHPEVEPVKTTEADGTKERVGYRGLPD